MTDHERARARVREREMLKKLPKRLLGRLRRHRSLSGLGRASFEGQRRLPAQVAVRFQRSRNNAFEVDAVECLQK